MKEASKQTIVIRKCRQIHTAAGSQMDRDCIVGERAFCDPRTQGSRLFCSLLLLEELALTIGITFGRVFISIVKSPIKFKRITCP